MKIRALLLLIWLSGFATLLPAQTIQQNQVTTQQLNVTTSASVAQTAGGTATPTQPGTSNYYYWVVSNASPNYSAPFGPIAATGVAPTLSASNPITITWAPAAGVSFYDLLRTTTTAVPTGACNCAVSIGVAKTTIVDSGAALQAYTVANGNTNISMSNQNVAGVPTLECTINGVTQPCTGAPQAIAPNQGMVYVVNAASGGLCGLQTNCYEVTGNVRVTADCATTASSPTVTSATANFTSQDLGKLIFCINRSTGAAAQRGTIVSVTSATSVTSSVNSTATVSGAMLAVGTDDAAQFQAAYNAALSTNQGISLPCGMFLLDSHAPVFAIPATDTVSQNYSISGCSGTNNTIFVLGPDLLDGTGDLLIEMPVYSNSFPLWNHGSSAFVHNLQVTGLGYVSSNNFDLIETAEASNLRIFDLGSSGTCWTIGNGFTASSFSGEQRYDHINIQADSGMPLYGCGGIYISQNTAQVAQGANVLADSVIAYTTAPGVFCEPGTSTAISGVCDLRDDFFYSVGTLTESLEVGNASTALIEGGNYESGTVPYSMFSVADSSSSLKIDGAFLTTQFGNANLFSLIAGATLALHNTTLYRVPAGHWFSYSTTAIFKDLGGNIFPNVPSALVPIIYGDASISGITQVASNITPSTGWGTTGGAGNGVSGVSGSTRTETFTITAAGTPAANPTVSIVFPVAFLAAPSGGCAAQQIGGTGAISDTIAGTAIATGFSFTWEATPVAGDTYSFRVTCSNP